jgi:endonuclease/exonuclease/phosphatase family metal-dependent hydrolase
MRIASFNVDSLDMRPNADVSLDERIPILRPQLERLGADVLCLQEINGQHPSGGGPRALLALDKLLEGTRYEGYARAASTAQSGAGLADVHNLVTLSRWPILRFKSIQNVLVPPLSYRPLTSVQPATIPLDIAFERPILVADIEIAAGRLVSVINVHFRAPIAAPIAGQKDSAFVWKSVAGWAEGYAVAAWKRTAQALETRLVIERLMDENADRLIIVAGDFNAEDHETPLKILIGAEEDTGNGRLAARALVVLDRSLAEDRRFSVLHHGRAQMLDHILANWPALAHFRGIEAHNETLSDELLNFARVRQEPGSPHAPIVAEFDMSNG